ncbi:TonB family protein [Sphingomonas sp.]|uniref:TonB family protein n=1 Tax=Sphingomonas sp. TaxID=28214 RepID=UPI0035BC8315
MAFARSDTRNRIAAALGAGAVQALLIYALVMGLSFHLPAALDRGLALFTVAPPAPPPPRTIPERRRSHRREGAASPRNLRSQATEIVAPPPIVPPPVASPVIAAPVAGTGAQASQGASDRPGPGTGSGGVGNGTGSGGSGDGDGDGFDTPPRWKRGRIKDSDYPRAAAEAGASGNVSVRYLIELDGRASHCVITKSSGNLDLDETTCRLIEQRFRYDPWRDARGRPVLGYVVRDNEWVLDHVPADPSSVR